MPLDPTIIRVGCSVWDLCAFGVRDWLLPHLAVALRESRRPWMDASGAVVTFRGIDDLINGWGGVLYGKGVAPAEAAARLFVVSGGLSQGVARSTQELAFWRVLSLHVRRLVLDDASLPLAELNMLPDLLAESWRNHRDIPALFRRLGDAFLCPKSKCCLLLRTVGDTEETRPVVMGLFGIEADHPGLSGELLSAEFAFAGMGSFRSFAGADAAPESWSNADWSPAG